MRTFVDTNVLVYCFDARDPAKHDLASARLAREAQTGELVVSTQVLKELYAALTRGRAPILAPPLAERAVRAVARYRVVAVQPQQVLQAIARAQRSQLSLWDALIIESAAGDGCSRLLTEDLTHGQVFDGVTLVDPFRTDPSAHEEPPAYGRRAGEERVAAKPAGRAARGRPLLGGRPHER